MKCSMGESGTARVCPYCGGKGYVSVPVELPPSDDPSKEPSRTTWVGERCPLCDGKGTISGNASAPSKFLGSLLCPADISAGVGASAVPDPPNRFQVIVPEGRELWPSICDTNCMRHTISDETIEELDRLVACRRVTITRLLASKLSWPVAANSCLLHNSIPT